VTNVHGGHALLLMQNFTLFIALLKRSNFFCFNHQTPELWHPSPIWGRDGDGAIKKRLHLSHKVKPLKNDMPNPCCPVKKNGSLRLISV